MMNQNANQLETDMPYSKMLLCYEQAAALVQARRAELRDELRALVTHKEGSKASALAQNMLEKRIMTLRDEYDDLSDAIREILGSGTVFGFQLLPKGTQVIFR